VKRTAPAKSDKRIQVWLCDSAVVCRNFYPAVPTACVTCSPERKMVVGSRGCRMGITSKCGRFKRA